MKKIVLLLFVCAAFAVASAQNERNRSTITVSVDGLNCTTSLGTGVFPALGWAFGVTSPTTVSAGGGSGSGKASVGTVNISKRADSCSPLLFGDVVSGRHIKTVTIVQESNKNEIFTVTLSTAIISSYQLGGDQSSAVPTEQISFNFAKICFADSQTGAKSCYNAQTGVTF